MMRFVHVTSLAIVGCLFGAQTVQAELPWIGEIDPPGVSGHPVDPYGDPTDPFGDPDSPYGDPEHPYQTLDSSSVDTSPMRSWLGLAAGLLFTMRLVRGA
jgi:hypothetical protein